MAFSYYRSLTIDHTKCGSSDSPYFPVLVSLSDATLKTIGNSGHIQNSNGYDIQFFSDSGLTTRLPAEREKYDGSGGSYIGWVQVPNISHTSNTVIYMGYDDAGISSDPNSDATYGSAKVWVENGTQNYQAVYHFGNGGSISLSDSTSNSNTLTLPGSTHNPSAGAGIPPGNIYGGVNVTASNQQYLKSVAQSVLGMNGSSATFTVEGWIYPTSGTCPLFGTTSGTGYGIELRVYTGGNVYFLNEAVNVLVNGGSSISSQWNQIGVSYNNGAIALYLNGSQVNTANSSVNWGSTPLVTLGGAPAVGEYNNGNIDEIHISNSIRSTAWITTEYNNQNSPGNIGSASFYTVGSEISTGRGIINNLCKILSQCFILGD